MTLAMSRARLSALARTGPEDKAVFLSDGRRLSYAEFGAQTGLPVFGFHGTPGSRFMFRLVDEPARRLGLRIIAPERPGFGRSTFQPGRRLADWAADVEELADRLGLSRFGVAGISGGGPYAVACSALLPDRVTASALISPMGPVRPPEGPKAIGSAQHAMFRLFYRMQPVMGGIFSLGRAMSLNAPDSMYRFILARASLVDRRILMRAAVQRNLLDGVTEGVRPGIQASVQEMRIFGMPWNLPFAAIKARTLLWQGTADRNVPVAAALRLAQLIPSCELIRLEGVGHYWIFEHIDEVLTKIKQVMISQKNA